MFALCVGRHRYLAEHLAVVFAGYGVETTSAVGAEEAMTSARARLPQIIFADYDLLVSTPLESWEADAVLGNIPVLAVSLTRRPEEVNILDMNGIGGFLYLPGMSDDEVKRVLAAVPHVPSYRPDHGITRPNSAHRQV